MKKISLCYAMVLLVLMLMGCSNENTTVKDNTEATVQPQTTADTQETVNQTEKTESTTAVTTTEQEPEQGDEWKEAYMKYIKENASGNDMETYKLVNINGDDIPELYINFGTTAGGEVVCTYLNNAVIDQTMWDGGFSYLEGENLFMDFGGHMDEYYNKIYSIRNGKMELLYSGEYGAKDNTNVSTESDGTPVYQYHWQGKEVASKQEYQKLLNKVFDTKHAVKPLDGAEYDEETFRYTGNGLYNYDEIIEAITSY